MPTIKDYQLYAETAFAAYAAQLGNGSGNVDFYKRAGMADIQAQHFDASWQVLAQQDLSDGFSAVLFERVNGSGQSTGEKVFAIRGTEASYWGIDYVVDVINIAFLGTSAGMQQYASLESFYQSLIVQGKLGAAENVVVTGHSLGGFLAQAFTAKHDSVVSATYTYNAPGFSVLPGVLTNIGTQLLGFFGLSGTVPNDKIFNVRALEGLSATAGLGQMLGSIQTVSIEYGDPIHNHSIRTLTDSLALYNLFATLDPNVSIGTITDILKASSNKAPDTLETALADVGKIFGKNYPAAETDRDTLYTNLYELQGILEGTSAGLLTVTSLADKPIETVANTAQTDIATRYALKELNPFAITGDEGLYEQFNAHGELDLYDPETGEGAITGQWLKDRAVFAIDKALANIADTKILSSTENWTMTDKKTNTTISLTNGSWLSPHILAFADDKGQTLAGGYMEDHLYGGNGSGNEILLRKAA